MLLCGAVFAAPSLKLNFALCLFYQIPSSPLSVPLTNLSGYVCLMSSKVSAALYGAPVRSVSCFLGLLCWDTVDGGMSAGM